MILEEIKKHFNTRKAESDIWRETRDKSKIVLYPSLSSATIKHKKYHKLEGKCLRAAFYNALDFKIEKETPVEASLMQSLGNYTEKSILDILDKRDLLIDKSIKFELKEYAISGKLDGIIFIDNKEVGIEIKSIGSNKWTYSSIFGSQLRPGYPSFKHLFQTLIYCFAFKDRLKKFILFYIRRDNGEVKEFEISIVPMNGEIYPVINGKIDERFTVTSILERFKLLKELLEKNQLPPREYMQLYPRERLTDFVKAGIISQKQADSYNTSPFGDFECRYCEYKDQCSKDGR